MSRTIHRLSPEVACQIAAGEVIERPVSVVKELLDNALDAKASQIRIDIFAGGIEGICIEDNGTGIFAEDMLLAIEPHSTSKIKTLNDLYHASTKGFRGEALASIASISKLSITSKPQEQGHAMQLTAQGGQTQLSAASRNQGTTIEVRDLFYNVPVRKKFLKAVSYEWQAIELLVKKFCLCAPQVQISLYHDGQLVLDLPSALIPEEHAFRIRKLWGKRFYDEAININVERSGLRLWGWLGALGEHRSQNDRLWVYLNQRIVQDKLITHALRQVYGPLLPDGRHAQCVLYLELPADMVDINVHPAKHEVRFEQPRLVYDFVVSSLKTVWLEKVMPTQTNIDVGQPHHQGLFSAGGFGAMSVMAQDWYLCNSDFIVLHLAAQLYYMVDVGAWWMSNIQRQLVHMSVPWTSRRLTLPFIKDIPELPDVLHQQVVAFLVEYGFEVDFWGEGRLCIRAIPECMPQLNLNEWVKVFKPRMTLDEVSIGHLLQCCQFSAYDLNETHISCIRSDLNDLDSEITRQFARCLDTKSCRKLFK